MSSNEVRTELCESANRNANRLLRVGARLAGATLALTGIGINIGNASAAQAESDSKNAQPITNPNLIPGSHHKEVARTRSLTFANYNEAASHGPTLRRGGVVLVNCIGTDQQGTRWDLINAPQKGFAGYWVETNDLYSSSTEVPACPLPYGSTHKPRPTTPTPTTTPTTTTTSTTIPIRPTEPASTTIPGSTGPATWPETVGGISHTWTDYSNAGGTEGQSISAYQTVQIACKLQGFKVEDGDTWWYRIESSPWDDNYYVSADAFYNNGETSGSLLNTPFVDNNVPNC